MAMRDLNEMEKSEIRRGISDSISSNNHQGQISLLTAECMSILTASQARFNELKEQGAFQRMFRTITGKNRKLQQLIQEDYVHCQFAIQHVLQVLADRQLFTLDMMSALQQRMYTMQLANEQKFLTIQSMINEFYDDTQYKLNHLQERITLVERGTKLIDWLILDDHQSYRLLPAVKRAMYIARDFFDMTEGKWTNRDLKYLEKVMDQLEMKESVTYQEIINEKTVADELFGKFVFSAQDLSLYLSRPMEVLVSGTGDSNEKWLMFQVPLRHFVYELLNTLSVLQALQMPEEQSYQVILEKLLDPKMRIHVNVCLHQQTNIPFEECCNFTQNLPVCVMEFKTREEAEQLKKALEKYKCLVEVI